MPSCCHPVCPSGIADHSLPVLNSPCTTVTIACHCSTTRGHSPLLLPLACHSPALDCSPPPLATATAHHCLPPHHCLSRTACLSPTASLSPTACLSPTAIITHRYLPLTTANPWSPPHTPHPWFSSSCSHWPPAPIIHSPSLASHLEALERPSHSLHLHTPT